MFFLYVSSKKGDATVFCKDGKGSEWGGGTVVHSLRWWMGGYHLLSEWTEREVQFYLYWSRELLCSGHLFINTVEKSLTNVQFLWRCCQGFLQKTFEENLAIKVFFKRAVKIFLKSVVKIVFNPAVKIFFKTKSVVKIFFKSVAKVREDDVWIASFPKCGTTWTQVILLSGDLWKWQRWWWWWWWWW